MPLAYIKGQPLSDQNDIQEAVEGANPSIRRKFIRFVNGGGVVWSLVDDPGNNEVEVSATAGSSLVPFGGDASEGDAVLAVSGPLSGVHNYNNLTINPAVVINVPANRALVIQCQGNFTNNGTLTAAGAGSAGGTAGVANGGAGGVGTVGQAPGGGGGSGGGGSTGGAGGAGTFSGLADLAGGTGGVVASGGAGTALATILSDLGLSGYSFLRPGAGGGGGGGGTGPNSTAGGAGGAGGGVILIMVRGNIIEGTISANGSAGANGVNGAPTIIENCGAGGGGGGGGAIMILYGGTRTPGTVTVSGGVGGAGGTDPNGGASGFSGGSGALGLLVRQKVG